MKNLTNILHLYTYKLSVFLTKKKGEVMSYLLHKQNTIVMNLRNSVEKYHLDR